jgi:hypothetical protein
MSRRFARSRSAWLPGVGRAFVVWLALAASSCSKSNVIVDPNDGLEGVPSPSLLVVWPDSPTPVATYADLGSPGPSTEDTLISVEYMYRTGPGAVQGMIVDYTAAGQFQVFRRQAGGFRLLKDFVLNPEKKLTFSETDIFGFTDTHPGPASLRDYVARGLIAGLGTPACPKTNVARTRLASVDGTLHYSAPTGIPPDYRPAPDSLPTLSWDSVPGAVGYLVHVYQLTNQGGDAIIASGLASPLYVSVTRDYFVAYFPAGVTSYKINDPVPTGVRILARRQLLNNQVYSVRVAAIDADGQLLAYTGTGSASAVFRSDKTYRVFPLGAALVNTKSSAPPPEKPAGLVPIPTARPDVWLYPPGTFPKRLP